MKTSLLFLFLFFSTAMGAQTFESELIPEGIVYPRMTTEQRNTLSASAVQGQCVYNVDHERVECFNGSSWETTHLISVPTISFLPNKQEDYFGFNTIDGAHFINAPPGEVHIQSPVNLPDKCIIRKVTYYYSDTDSGTDVWFSFVRQTHENPAVIKGWFVPSVDTTYGSITRIINDTIDNNTYYYYLEMSENPNIVGVGPFMDGDFRIYSAILEYTQ